jgi:hypothetical protein
VPGLDNLLDMAAKKHGMSHTPEWYAYYNARRRCNDANAKDWKNYGARGIRFRFRSFEEFLDEVGPRPPYTSLDRIKNDGNYEPGNVRWSEATEQTANRRDTVIAELDDLDPQ